MKFLKESRGSVTAICIKDKDPDAIIGQYYLFWNWKATGGELHWLSANAAYFWTNERKLKSGLRNIVDNRFAMRTGYELEGNNYKKYLRRKVAEELKKFEDAEFLPPEVKRADEIFEFSSGDYWDKEENEEISCRQDVGRELLEVL